MLRLGPAPAVVERERCAVQPRQHPFAFRLPSCTVAAQDLPAIREGRAWAACTSTPPRVARSAGCQAVLRSMSSRALPARRVRDAEAPLRRCRSPVPSVFDVRTAPGCPPVISPRMIRFPGSKSSTAAIRKTVGRKYCQAQARCRPRSWTRETDEKHSRNGVTPTSGWREAIPVGVSRQAIATAPSLVRASRIQRTRREAGRARQQRTANRALRNAVSDEGRRTSRQTAPSFAKRRFRTSTDAD